MQLRQITRANVLAALAECDRLGRGPFLSEYGFKEAREYFLIHNGRCYDSKAIAGVAYGLQTKTEVTSTEFTGGAAVARILADLGFVVTEDANWRWPELVLACNLLHRRGWEKTLRAEDPEVQELSAYLRTLNPLLALAPRFRSPGSVQRKLENLRTTHPNYPGKPTRSGKLTEKVVTAYVLDPEALNRLATELMSNPSLAAFDPTAADLHSTTSDLESIDDAHAMSAFEGAAKRRWANHRERDPKLRAAKISEAKKTRGSASCEVCNFDFAVSYPGHGDGYIEVHHRVPLHISGEVHSTLDDLALLCANCHRMIHRTKTWMTPEELRSTFAGNS